MELYGKFVPEGMEVASNVWVVQRDPGVFGPDAEVFRPGRWLQLGSGPGSGSLEERAREHASKYTMLFGYGSRACLGKVSSLGVTVYPPLSCFRSTFLLSIGGF